MEKVVLLGCGYLAEYLMPCYEKRLGDALASHMAGVKGRPERLEDRQKAFPFPLQVQGTPELLRSMQPDLILIAVKPNQVPAVVEKDLQPYFDECRQNGRKLPVVYSFAPAPSVYWMSDALGEGALVCNMLPNMVSWVDGVYVAQAGASFLSFDTRACWPEQEKEEAMDFMQPTGRIITIPGEVAAEFLAVHEGMHAAYDFVTNGCEVLEKRGEELSYAGCAGALRDALRLAIPGDYLTPIAIPQEMKAEYRPFWEKLIKEYIGGVLDYAESVGIPKEKAILKTSASMEMFLLFLQHADPEKIRDAVSKHATKGGVLEMHNRMFERWGKDLLRKGWEDYLDGRLADDFYEDMRQVAFQIANVVGSHTAGLAGTV